MPELEERIREGLTGTAPQVQIEGVFERLSARRRRRQLRRVVVPASAVSLVLLLGAALLWPSDSNTPVATKGGDRVTTETTRAGDSNEPTDSSVITGDAPATAGSRSTPGRSAGADGRASPTAASLVPAGFQFFTPRGGPTNEVRIARFDYTDQRLLFTYPQNTRAGAPSWSPTRDRIAVSYCTSAPSCTLRTVTTDGKISATLGEGVIHSNAARAWSPDGRWIAVQKSFEDPDASIVPSSGGAARTVGVDTAMLAWSPDSKRIAFVDTGVLTIANVDGSGVRKFVDPMQRDMSRTTQPVSVAAWSPNGQTLAVSRGYLSKQEDTANNPMNTPTPATALIDVDAGTWREVGDWEFRGDWTHDGSSLIVRVPKVWTTAIGARGCPGDSPVVGLDIRTGARRSFGEGCSMGLSPDGAAVFVSEMRRVRVVRVAGTDSHGRVAYTPDEDHPTRGFNVHCCHWSPGSDAVVETDHGVVVRIDGRGRWEPPG